MTTTPAQLTLAKTFLARQSLARASIRRSAKMTRARKIGYFHAALTAVWFSIMALDRFQVVNGVLGDGGCMTISWFFGLPLSWLAAMIIGFPLFSSMPEHFIRMSIMGAVVIVNGLVVGYFVDWFLSWAGIPDRSRQENQEAEQVMRGNRR